MRIPFIGLRIEIIISFILLMTLSILILSMIIIKITGRDMIKREIEEGEIIASSIKNSLELIPLKNQNLQNIVDTYYKNYKLKEICFVDNNHRIIAHNDKTLIGKYYRNNNNLLTISKPIKHVGILFIRPFIKKGLPISERFILLYILFNSIILIILGSFLLSRLIVNPIDKLVKVTEKIADGDLTQRVPLTYKNEIGRLADSFNKMVDSLKESINIRDNQLEELNRINRELKEAQEGVVRAEKLATMGRLAAGIAHEIGNPLNIILGYIALFKKVKDEKRAESYLEKIEEEINRINKIIRDLLDLSRPSKFIVSDTDINKYIRSCMELLSHEIKKKDIKLEYNLNADIPIVKIDGERFKQVIINLLINSIDAVDNNGRISISTEFTIFSKDSIKSLKFKDGDRVIIVSISDNGRGISKENINRIFDPYFTTKEPGKGTGLGLTICQQIIDSFNGDIVVESEEGSGTTFRVILPEK
jgi:hypothetical protein